MTARLADILGLDNQAVGLANMERAAALAMARLGLGDRERYIAILKADPTERRRLAGMAVVQETWFFRDGEPFSLLGRLARGLMACPIPGPVGTVAPPDGPFPGVIPGSATQSPSGPLRLLSTPCATGEEPYSMAMALLEAGVSPEQFSVDAADVHGPALDAARLGRFGPGSFRSDLGPYARYFSADGPDRLVANQVRQSVRFFEADALDPGFLRDAAPYSVIFCRNLLLYLAPPARQKLAENLRRLLAPGGLLFAGHAEVPVLFSLGFSPAPYPKAFACTLAAPGTATPERALFQPAGRLSVPCGQAQPPAAATRPLRSGEIPAPPRLLAGQASWMTTGAGRLGLPGTSDGRWDPASPSGPVVPYIPAIPHIPNASSGPDAQGLMRPAGVAPRRMADPRALADAGRLSEALAILEEDLAALGPSAERFHLLGVTFLALGRDKDAEEALRKAVYLDPCHAGALTHLELLHARAGRVDEASRMALRAKRAGGERP